MSNRTKVMETFVDVVGYEGRYVISNIGNVMRTMKGHGSKIGRILKPYTTKNGYLQIKLSKNCIQQNYYVHRLVAEAFLSKSSLETVNHINGDKTDNRVDNLEFMSRSDNTSHSNHVLGNKPTGEKNGNSKLTEQDVIAIKQLLLTKSHVEISKMFGVSRPTITEISIGRKWKHLSMPLVCGT